MKYSYTSSEGKNLPAVILATVLVLILAGGAALFATGFLKVGQFAANTNQGGLCKDLISEYNNTFTQTSAEDYTKKLATSAKSASEIKDNQTDPNCVFIQFTNAGFTSNANDATKFADILKSLSKEGKYITGELANPLGINAIEKSANELKSATGTDGASTGKGNG